MAREHENSEQETQKKKGQSVRKDTGVDTSDADEGIEQETQHEKQAASQKGSNGKS